MMQDHIFAGNTTRFKFKPGTPERELEEAYASVEASPSDVDLRVKVGHLALGLGKKQEAIASFVFAMTLEGGRRDILATLHAICTPEEMKLFRIAPPVTPFWRDIQGLLGYPFAGRGVGMVLVGALFFDIATLAGGLIGLLAVPIMTVLWGYLAAHFVNIIRSSGVGHEQVPDWPDMHHPLDLASDLHRWNMALIAAYLPAFVLLSPILVGAPRDVVGPLALLAAVAGTFLYPMMMLVTTLYHNKYAAFNYAFVLRSIARVPKEYFFAWVVFIVLGGLAASLQLLTHALGFGMSTWLLIFDRRIASELVLLTLWILFTTSVSIFAYSVFSRVLGMIYYLGKDRLLWFKGEE